MLCGVTHPATYMARENSLTHPKAMKLISFLWPIYPRWCKYFKKTPRRDRRVCQWARLPGGFLGWGLVSAMLGHAIDSSLLDRLVPVYLNLTLAILSLPIMFAASPK